MSEQTPTICILTNVPEEYDIGLGGFEEKLILDKNDASYLTVEDICDKLQNRRKN